MAGVQPANIISNIAGQVASKDPEPISRAILSGIATIAGLFGAAHAAAMKKEAQTLSAAVPQWRELTFQTVQAYNSGQIDANQAIDYINQAMDVWRTQVAPIKRGNWPYRGSQLPEPTFADSYADRSGPFGSSNKNPDSHAPDPCNGACVLTHYMVEREALLLKQAFASGQSVTIELEEIVVANTGGQGGVPAAQLQISPPILSQIPGVGELEAAIENSSLPPIVKQYPLVFAALAVFGLVLIVRR